MQDCFEGNKHECSGCFSPGDRRSLRKARRALVIVRAPAYFEDPDFSFIYMRSFMKSTPKSSMQLINGRAEKCAMPKASR